MARSSLSPRPLKWLIWTLRPLQPNALNAWKGAVIVVNNNLNNNNRHYLLITYYVHSMGLSTLMHSFI